MVINHLVAGMILQAVNFIKVIEETCGATLPTTNIAPENMVVGRLLSFEDGYFSGSMLNLGNVSTYNSSLQP